MDATNPHEILKFPLSTEKAVRDMEMTNSLIFIVDLKANKRQIKWATQKAFNVKVLKVRTMITRKGEKKAYIQLSPDTPAAEITTQLGLL